MSKPKFGDEILIDNGSGIIYIKYPYTDQPERLSSLLKMLKTIEICSVAFELFERLKKDYRFKFRR